MREFRKSGSVRDGDGNVPIYSAMTPIRPRPNICVTRCKVAVECGTSDTLEQELIRSGVRGGQIEGQACGHVEPEGAVWVHMAPEERGQRPLLGDAHVFQPDRLAEHAQGARWA